MLHVHIMIPGKMVINVEGGDVADTLAVLESRTVHEAIQLALLDRPDDDEKPRAATAAE